jgi:hypothetical protein
MNNPTPKRNTLDVSHTYLPSERPRSAIENEINSAPTPEPNPDSYLGKLNQDPKYRELVEEEREKPAPTQESWEERFEKLYLKKRDVKAFIRQVRQEAFLDGFTKMNELSQDHTFDTDEDAKDYARRNYLSTN